jgi:toxin ParE1/3/4
MAQVRRTPSARRDLDDIGRYIARHDLDAALRLLNRIDEKCALLAGNPLLGEVWPELGDNVRHLTVGNYVIFYEPVASGIRVLRVLHGHRDIPTAFRGA